MKILINGNLKKIKNIKIFTCKNCGCVFEAKEHEYQIHLVNNKEYCFCECPYCDETVM